MAFRPENLFKVYLGHAGEVLIAIRGQDSEPNDPLLMYDGRDHAVLRRNKEDVVILDHLHPEVRGPLRACGRASIAELDTSPDAVQPKREYSTPVRVLDRLPFDFTKLLP